MGDIADDVLAGFQCSGCGVCFEKEHGYPVLCGACWSRAPKSERARLSRATKAELVRRGDEQAG